MQIGVDRVHSLPRRWSNRELKKFAFLFHGDVVNVSGWKDIDKEGKYYRDYFVNARSYSVTNYKPEYRGLQGTDGEIFLDLEKKLPDRLRRRFDVVFNHTTLEHVFQVKTAFRNLCEMSGDIVILVVPFLQPHHGWYGDYWRFSPSCIKKMFDENRLELLYQRFNHHRRSSVYVISIASRHPEKWRSRFQRFSSADFQKPEDAAGDRAFANTSHRAVGGMLRLIKSPLRFLKRVFNSHR